MLGLYKDIGQENGNYKINCVWGRAASIISCPNDGKVMEDFRALTAPIAGRCSNFAGLPLASVPLPDPILNFLKGECKVSGSSVTTCSLWLSCVFMIFFTHTLPKLTWKPKKGPIKTTVPLKGAIWVSILAWGSVVLAA